MVCVCVCACGGTNIKFNLTWFFIWPKGLQPSKHARSDLPKPDTVSQNQIISRLVLHNYDLGHLWKNTTWVWKWETGGSQLAGCILPELGLVILAHQLIFRLDVFAKIWPSQIRSGWFYGYSAHHLETKETVEKVAAQTRNQTHNLSVLSPPHFLIYSCAIGCCCFIIFTLSLSLLVGLTFVVYEIKCFWREVE